MRDAKPETDLLLSCLDTIPVNFTEYEKYKRDYKSKLKLKNCVSRTLNNVGNSIIPKIYKIISKHQKRRNTIVNTLRKM